MSSFRHVPPQERTLVHHDTLTVLKQVAQETSESGGVLRCLGTLSDGTSPDIWIGPVSLRRRLQSGELNQGHLDLAEQQLARHYVAVSAKGAERCMEDRTTEGYRPDDASSYGRPLGPQVQGGTTQEAVVRRLDLIAKGESVGKIDRVTLGNDVAAAAKRPGRRFKPGGHTAETDDPNKTGCASNDEEVAKLKTYSVAEAARAIKHMTTTVSAMGNLSVGPRVLEDLRESAGELHGVAPTYFGENLMAALGVVRQYNATGVPRVVGEHAAFALVINFDETSTLHTDEYNTTMKALTGRDIMAFGLDAGHIMGEHPPAFAAQIIAEAINTALQVTDGSLRLYVRLPASAPSRLCY